MNGISDSKHVHLLCFIESPVKGTKIGLMIINFQEEEIES